MATVNGTVPLTPKRAGENKWYDTINSETSSRQKTVQYHYPPNVRPPVNGTDPLTAKRSPESKWYSANSRRHSKSTGKPLQYEEETAPVLAQFINEINHRVAANTTLEQQHGQQHLLPKGLKIWGTDARKAAMKEMDQLHHRGAFAPVDPNECSKSELAKAQVALMFVTEKRDGTIKARSVYNGKPTRVWQSKDEARSPTVSLEGLMLTLCVDAKENRDVMTLDVPNAFIQTAMPQPTDGSDRVIMKIDGTLAELLVEIDPDRYRPYLVYEKGKPVQFYSSWSASEKC